MTISGVCIGLQAGVLKSLRGSMKSLEQELIGLKRQYDNMSDATTLPSIQLKIIEYVPALDG